ncbi:hypothetical protein PENTCL1PPCAC_12247, partial [Pristionchus entomophagus]
VKITTPTDPEEKRKYKEKRKKNNESAERHRNRNKLCLVERDQLLKEVKALRTKCNRHNSEMNMLKKQNEFLRQSFVTHKCVSSEVKK